jgi:hypothetical protein
MKHFINLKDNAFPRSVWLSGDGLACNPGVHMAAWNRFRRFAMGKTLRHFEAERQEDLE